MTQEDKELLLKDLCARLPYGVKIMFSSNGFRWDWEQTLEEISRCEDGEYAINGWGIHGIKPFLRPISSMTEEERKELRALCEEDLSEFAGFIRAGHGLSHDGLYMFDKMRQLEWLLKNHFDYHGLIDKGLAIKAPKDMYEL